MSLSAKKQNFLSKFFFAKISFTMKEKLQRFLPVIVGSLVIGLILFGTVFALNKMFNTPVDFDANSITFFYGDTCPHCKTVEEFFSEKKMDEKVQFSRKEIYNNLQNRQAFDQAVKLCKMDAGSAGVPFVYAKGECFFGTPDVIGYFEQYLGN